MATSIITTAPGIPEGSPFSTTAKLTNQCSPVSKQTIVLQIQKIEQFKFDAPDWQDAAQLKSAWVTNQFDLDNAATASIDKHAEVYICLAKARAILSQRGDKYARMRDDAGILNPKTGKRLTWSEYFAGFQSQYNFDKCLRTVQFKLAEISGKKRVTKKPDPPLQLTAADKRRLVDSALESHHVIEGIRNGGDVTAAVKELQKNLPPKDKLQDLADNAARVLTSDNGLKTTKSIAPRRTTPLPFEIDLDLVNETLSVLEEVAKQLQQGDLAIRVRNLLNKLSGRTDGPMTRSEMREAIEERTGPAPRILSGKKPIRQPRVWDCHAGKDVPADAVYVGCRVLNRKGEVIREGTIFGNGTHPLVSHKGALHTEIEFRAYAIEKLEDASFRAEAEKLRGRDLLCWCVQEGKGRKEFCHARVWLELINNAQGELPSAGLSTEQRRDFDWGYYEPQFLSKEEADALFEMAKAQPRVRPIIKRSGYELRRCASTLWSVRDRHAEDSDLMVPLAAAPPEIISLKRKLSALAGKEINYFSLQAYENERDHIGFHQHREDKCRDARVFIVSLGERRTFGVDKLCPDCLLCDACNQRRCHPGGPPCSNPVACRAAKKHRTTCAVRTATKTTLLPEHGSLIFLTSEANNWYEHAVLDDKEPKGLRVSINTKCIPPEDAPAGYVPRELRSAGGFAQVEIQE